MIENPNMETGWCLIEPNIFEDREGTRLMAKIKVYGRKYVKVIALEDYAGRGGRDAALTYLHRWLGSCRHAAKRFSVDDDDLMPRYVPPRRYASQYMLWIGQS